MSKNEGKALVNLCLAPEQTASLQKMVDAGLYGSITVPTTAREQYILSHIAMNKPPEDLAMHTPAEE